MPGQFLMMRLAGCDDPLLGRPLALYDTVLDAGGRPQGLDVVYLVLGKMTSRLATYRPGQALEVWGPLGNGFPPAPAEHLLMVAGGIGQTPFLALARESWASAATATRRAPFPRHRASRSATGPARRNYWPGSKTSSRWASTCASAPTTARPGITGW